MEHVHDLLPCPFCGSTDVVVFDPEVVPDPEEAHAEVIGSMDVDLGFVSCNGCGAFGPSGSTTEHVVGRWNRRAPNVAPA